MEINKKSLKEIQKRVKKLVQLEEELENFSGFAIPITRLTILKYLCRNSLGMCIFALYIAKKTEPRISYKDDNGEEQIKMKVQESLLLMETIIEQSIINDQLMIKPEQDRQILALSRELFLYQNETKNISRASVRQIKNWQIFLVEQSLNPFKYPDYPEKGYELGRSYAEKYEPRHGTGLIGESLEYVRDIREYWQTYYEKKKQSLNM